MLLSDLIGDVVFSRWPLTTKQWHVASLTLVGLRETVYVVAHSLTCQWEKNSWQCAWGCVEMRVRWNGACHVVTRILKCSIFFQGVTTCHDEIVVPLACHFRAHRVSWMSWTVRNLCVTYGTMTQTASSLPFGQDRLRDTKMARLGKLARHIAGHCGKKVRASMRLALSK